MNILTQLKNLGRAIFPAAKNTATNEGRRAFVKNSVKAGVALGVVAQLPDFVFNAAEAQAASGAPNVATVNGYETIVYPSLGAGDEMVVVVRMGEGKDVTLHYNEESGHGTLCTEIKQDGLISPYFVNFTTIEGGQYRTLTSGQSGNLDADAGRSKQDIVDRARIEQEIDMAFTGAQIVAKNGRTGPMGLLIGMAKEAVADPTNIQDQMCIMEGIRYQDRTTHTKKVGNKRGDQVSVTSHDIITQFRFDGLPPMTIRLDGRDALNEIVRGAQDQVTGYFFDHDFRSFEDSEKIKVIKKSVLKLISNDLTELGAPGAADAGERAQHEGILRAAMTDLTGGRRLSLAPTPQAPTRGARTGAPTAKFTV